MSEEKFAGRSVLNPSQAANVYLRDDDEVQLTVRGLATASDSDPAVNVSLSVVAYLGQREQDFQLGAPVRASGPSA
jgi:hypothetical protein